MKYFLKIIVGILFFSGCQKAQDSYNSVKPNPVFGTVTDVDGNVYKTVIIGEQEWMAENLKVEHYRNGDVILWVQDDKKWHNTIRDACCYSVLDVDNNVVDTGKFFGILYNWWAVDDQRGLAPEGWHIPSWDEWVVITDYLGGEKVAGIKMKSNSGWGLDGNGTNESGFTGLSAGLRDYDGSFGLNGYYAIFWTTTVYKTDHIFAITFNLNYDNESTSGDVKNKRTGVSVRCVKD